MMKIFLKYFHYYPPQWLCSQSRNKYTHNSYTIVLTVTWAGWLTKRHLSTWFLKPSSLKLMDSLGYNNCSVSWGPPYRYHDWGVTISMLYAGFPAALPLCTLDTFRIQWAAATNTAENMDAQTDWAEGWTWVRPKHFCRLGTDVSRREDRTYA